MSALADQIVAAALDGETLCGGNRHLTEDECIGELVEFAANGRHTFDFDHLVGGPVQAGLRVLPSEPEASARYAHEPAVPNGRLGCERCGVPYGSSSERNVPDWWDDGYEGRDGTRHTVWVPAGSAVIEIVVCKSCKDYLDESFAPVEWR